MKRDAWKRLEAIEARAESGKTDRSPEAAFALVIPTLVAARLGGWREHESVASAYARAMGLETRELAATFSAGDFADLRARHATVVSRLFRDVGIDLRDASADNIVATTDKMIADLPGRLQRLIAHRADISEARVAASVVEGKSP